MGTGDPPSRESVLAAIKEFNDSGREAFLTTHGFGPARNYFLVHDGARYDSKAIYSVAYGYEHPDEGPLASSEFSGGEGSVANRLESAGFQIERAGPQVDQRVWLIRAGREGRDEKLALDQEAAVIGWSNLGRLSPDVSRDELKASLRSIYGEERPASLASQAGQIYRFLNEVAVGDLVVLPLMSNPGHVAIGTVIGDYVYRNDGPFATTDAQHTRHVEWLTKDLPRDALEQDLSDALGQQGTVSEITKPDATARLLNAIPGNRRDLGRLFLLTAGNKLARQHFETSMQLGIAIDEVERVVDLPAEVRTHARNGRVFAWGAQAGGNAEKKWERLESGDVGLVYSEGKFLAWCRVYAKTQSDAGARSIWGQDEGGKTWECMTFFDPVIALNVPRARVIEALGYKSNYIPQGFEIPGEDIQTRIRERFGSAQGLIESFASPRVWWVNQGTTFARSREAGSLWAPKKTKDGRKRPDWESLSDARVSDLVLNYRNGKIRAVSRVTAQAADAPRPADADQRQWENDGRLLDVDFNDLSPSISLNDIPVEWRIEEGGPFDQNGKVKQGYFYSLSEEFVSKLAGRFPSLELVPNAPSPTLDLTSICGDFSRKLRDSYLVFGDGHDQLVRSFIASLATKPFAILTGLSGSGKTQLAMGLGQWFGADRTLITPVRPDWTGAEALFGYEDALQPAEHGQQPWHVPASLEFMLRAAGDPNNPYLLVLDEMNLAHVERYFADVLSGMESRKPCLPNLRIGPDGRWRHGQDEPKQISFPRNLFVAGTVNVDETTYMFSPKVLDRANTFEFRVQTRDLSIEARRPGIVREGDRGLAAGFLAIASDDEWHLRNPSPIANQLAGDLRALHGLLSEGGFEFGHRVFYEALRFSAMLNASGEPDPRVALDLVLLQKVLPRMHGSRRRLEPTLTALGKFCVDRSYDEGSMVDLSTGFDPLAPGDVPADLPSSLDKVQRMTRTLRANQFASFTD